MTNTALSYNLRQIFFQFLNLPWAIKIVAADIWGLYFKTGKDINTESMD